jgi:hypothetical protein
MRPRKASPDGLGCSKISLSMKCGNGALLDLIQVPGDLVDLLVDGMGVDVGGLLTPSGVSTAMSQSSR